MSRLPFEQMMASLRPVSTSSSKDGTIMSWIAVMSVASQTHPAGLGSPAM